MGYTAVILHTSRVCHRSLFVGCSIKNKNVCWLRHPFFLLAAASFFFVGCSIRAAGGRVFPIPGDPLKIPRVWLKEKDTPGLATSRAFGDFQVRTPHASRLRLLHPRLRLLGWVSYGFGCEVSYGFGWEVSCGFGWEVSYGFGWEVSYGFGCEVSYGFGFEGCDVWSGQIGRRHRAPKLANT